jgi:hypothetical protein
LLKFAAEVVADCRESRHEQVLSKRRGGREGRKPIDGSALLGKGLFSSGFDQWEDFPPFYAKVDSATARLVLNLLRDIG